MIGETEPNGRRSRRTTVRRWTRVPASAKRAILEWKDAVRALGSAQDMANKLGLRLDQVYNVCKQDVRKLNSPDPEFYRCAECRKPITSGNYCAECQRTEWRSQ